jgi:hypothetical protein
VIDFRRARFNARIIKVPSTSSESSLADLVADFKDWRCSPRGRYGAPTRGVFVVLGTMTDEIVIVVRAIVVANQMRLMGDAPLA